MSETQFTPGPWEAKRDPCHYDTLSTVEAGAADVTRRPDVKTLRRHYAFSAPERHRNLLEKIEGTT